MDIEDIENYTKTIKFWYETRERYSNDKLNQRKIDRLLNNMIQKYTFMGIINDIIIYDKYLDFL